MALPAGSHPQLPRGALLAIAEFTSSVLAHGGMEEDAGSLFIAADMLLDAWASLLVESRAWGAPG